MHSKAAAQTRKPTFDIIRLMITQIRRQGALRRAISNCRWRQPTLMPLAREVNFQKGFPREMSQAGAMWFWSGRLSPYYAGSAFQNFTMSCRASRARRHLFRRPSRLAPLFALIFLLFAAPAWIAVSRRSFAQTAPPLDYPRLIDITDSTGIHFDHQSSPEQSSSSSP